MNSVKVIDKIVGAVVIVFLLTIIILGLYGNYKMQNEPFRVVIGTIEGVSIGGKTAASFSYSYCIEGRKYNGATQVNGRYMDMKLSELRLYVGSHFFVKVNENSYYISRLQLDRPVFENCEKQPFKGWENYPIEK